MHCAERLPCALRCGKAIVVTATCAGGFVQVNNGALCRLCSVVHDFLGVLQTGKYDSIGGI